MKLADRLRELLLPIQPCPACGEPMTYGEDGRQWCEPCGYVPCACDGG